MSIERNIKYFYSGYIKGDDFVISASSPNSEKTIDKFKVAISYTKPNCSNLEIGVRWIDSVGNIYLESSKFQKYDNKNRYQIIKVQSQNRLIRMPPKNYDLFYGPPYQIVFDEKTAQFYTLHKEGKKLSVLRWEEQ